MKTMDTSYKFKSPMVSGWVFHIAATKGELPSTPVERAKKALDAFVKSVRKSIEPLTLPIEA